MSGRAEGAIGMGGGVPRVTVSGLEGAPEKDQEDTQNAEQQPRSADATALRQRF
jgi:hypothetical protein